MDVQTILDEAVAAGVAPGMVAAAIAPGGARLSASAGVRGVDNPAPMGADTVFWIASLTKAVTTVAALQMVERGLVGLDEPLGGRLPALAAPRLLSGFDADGKPVITTATRPVTLRALLTHTAGFGYEFFSDDLARYAAARTAPAGWGHEPDSPLLFEPGERWQYGIGVDWAGRLVETLSGQSLDAYMAQHIFGPLGMADTSFFPDAALAARKASVHQRLPDGGVVAIPFGMPPAPYFSMGGGGLYSTAGDYLTFLSAILAGGAGILQSPTAALMGQNHIGEIGAGVLKSSNANLTNDFEPMPGGGQRHGRGFLLNQTALPGGRSAGSLAWAGLANCYYWADPTTGVAGVLMAQVLPFADPRVLETFDAFERAVYAS